MRTLHPLDKPVRVRRVKLKRNEECARCWDAGSHYVIEIHSGLCRQATWQFLAHEWAHLMLGEYDPRHWDDGSAQHPDEFYRLLGTIERAWNGEIGEEHITC